MSVGQVTTASSVDATLTALCVQIRNIMNTIREQATPIAILGAAGLEALPPGSRAAAYTSAEAAEVVQAFAYLTNNSGCYYGTVQQGGTGGNGAILFNFDNALSKYWAGQ